MQTNFDEFLGVKKKKMLTDLAVVTRPVAPSNPCTPSPCGNNAICTERNGAGACKCMEEYYGDPYVGCRPECVFNDDCPHNRACVSNKCRDPCPGVCGLNAECRVTHHNPVCSCLQGYVGDPLKACRLSKQNVRHLSSSP